MVTNEDVLRRVNEIRCIIKIIESRLNRLAGHILRHGVLLELVIEGVMDGRVGQGRPRLCSIDNKEIEI